MYKCFAKTGTSEGWLKENDALHSGQFARGGGEVGGRDGTGLAEWKTMVLSVLDTGGVIVMGSGGDCNRVSGGWTDGVCDRIGKA